MAHKKGGGTSGICDRCSDTLAADEDWYLVWSEAIMATGQEMGVMVICESCANKVFTEDVWREAKPIAVEVDLDLIIDPFGYMSKLQQVNDYSIAMRAKGRGLGPAEARQEARELAQLWRKDESAAVRQLRAQKKR